MINIIINVLSLTGGYTPPTDGQEVTTDGATVDITVNEETRTDISKNEESYSGITLSGKEGETLKISLSIRQSGAGNVIYSTSKTIKIGEENTVIFE